MTAQHKYTDYQKTIQSQLTHLQALLHKHAAEADTVHYGHVGDLAHVVGELADVIEFMGGSRDAAGPDKYWAKTSDGYRVVTVPQD